MDLPPILGVGVLKLSSSPLNPALKPSHLCSHCSRLTLAPLTQLLPPDAPSGERSAPALDI